MALCRGLFCFAVVRPFVNKELGNCKVKLMAYLFFSFLTYFEKAFFI